MTTVIKKYTDLLDKHSEIAKESCKISDEFNVLLKESLGYGIDPQRRDLIAEMRDELIDKHERLVFESNDIVKKRNRLLGGIWKWEDSDGDIPEGHGKLVRERDMLLYRNDEITDNSVRFFEEIDKPLPKLIKKKETNEINTTFKTALYFGHVIAATLVYLMH